MKKALHEVNRLSSNTTTVEHDSHTGDQAAFLRNGDAARFPQEHEPDGHRMLPPEGMPRPPSMYAIAAHRVAA
ncbi:hypothetical protein [Burkholderia anthina]|uniref:Uncharacterized protein n=1 Tax=Burkholderia anthina TaxID=179879 RepID=A0AAW3PTY1_9BURK|nr:hypothetical protein [Burkholderia anthina]KVE03982.1 hypothetical protein WS65_21130 [Burkholderia anthina]KWZ31942.1 hypothetical protein WS64_27285 [Burkholderia anthina]